MNKIKDYINIDKAILSGNPVFKGTSRDSIFPFGEGDFLGRISFRLSISNEKTSDSCY